ncbi:MAG: NlpC/P60 family protein [Gemmatimonadaceae bacterium]
MTQTTPTSETAAPRETPGSPRPASFVVVRAAVAPMHTEPRVSSPQTSQALAGHVLLVREERGDWLHVAGVDAYRGWMHRGYVTYVPRAEEMEAHDVRVRWEAAPDRLPWMEGVDWVIRGVSNDLATRVSLGCRARCVGGPAIAFPLGALVPDECELVEGRAAPRDELPRLFPPDDAAAIARTAVEHFAGTSYQWGGVTPWGADCSGLVQSTFQLHGRTLPRDAWQQALLGADAGGDPTALRPADLLFFSDRADRRVTHVGISLGGPRMVHLALGRGGHAVERLDDAGDPYVAKLLERFTGARRVIG